MKKNYSKDIYKMYEEEFNRAEKLLKDIKNLKLDNSILTSNLKCLENKINNEIEKSKKTLLDKIEKLENDLKDAYLEIDRLKNEIDNKNESKNYVEKDYLIDKLSNQVNKDSSNSSIPTSKEIKHRRTNTFNHRKASTNSSGGQFNHTGKTLAKREVERKIKENNIIVREIKHYVDDKKYKNNVEKYCIGIEITPYIEKHIFIPNSKSKEVLPQKFYSDVTYCDDIKSIIVLLGNYCSLPYNKIKDLISSLTGNIVDFSEGTIDNIYKEFAKKSENTIDNIVNNIINGIFQHTDETVTRENGKDTYYCGYGNKENVYYSYHHQKGDKPIEEDNILPRFFGTVISDHEIGIYKYGTSNQTCIVHFGRYCIEQEQNITITCWQMKLYNLLLKFERNRRICIKFGLNKFNDNEINYMEKEYDDILSFAEKENEFISSTYWKDKANTLLKRCTKYKTQMLLFIHNFGIDYDNNFMERALRMIKGKTKVSGGFRSEDGGIRFGKTMSIIKTSILRKINPFNSIKAIMNGQTLFA